MYGIVRGTSAYTEASGLRCALGASVAWLCEGLLLRCSLRLFVLRVLRRMRCMHPRAGPVHAMVRRLS